MKKPSWKLISKIFTIVGAVGAVAGVFLNEKKEEEGYAKAVEAYMENHEDDNK